MFFNATNALLLLIQPSFRLGLPILTAGLGYFVLQFVSARFKSLQIRFCLFQSLFVLFYIRLNFFADLFALLLSLFPSPVFLFADLGHLFLVALVSAPKSVMILSYC